MAIRLAATLFALLATGALARSAVPAPAGAPLAAIDFVAHPGPRTIRKDGAVVTIRPRKSGGNMVVAVADIQVPGFAPMRATEATPAGANYPRSVGIGKLARTDAAPSVLLVGYTGGAHCCVALQVIVPLAGRLRTVAFPDFDGAVDRFPRDIDGDGVADFVLVDNRFLYAFGSYAGSLAPPQIFDIIGGRIVDVSAKPGFRPLFASFIAKARPLCADRNNEDRNGACAGYVAAAARLGRYAPALRDANAMANRTRAAWLPDGCSLPTGPSGCPKGRKVKFHSFTAALAWFLKDAGYIR